MDRAVLVPALKNIATRLRIDSVRSTTEAGSGHPTSCCSAADLVAALFFAEMRFDPNDPQHPGSDRFVLSKGHAAPLLYAAWAEAGAFDRAELLKLRELGSDLEGHPTPRLPFVDVATGSLGQGICAAVGSALNARRIASDYRTYCMLGDGESAEGSVWEAAEVAAFDGLDNLCAITDVNGARPEPRHDVGARPRAVRPALARIRLARDRHRRPRSERHPRRPGRGHARIKGRPTMIVARTIKGKGVSFAEGKDGWHGRAFKKGEELDRALAELEQQFVPEDANVDAGAADRQASRRGPPSRRRRSRWRRRPTSWASRSRPARPTASALAKLGEADARVVALDADVKNSTFSDKFEKAFPDRFYQNFIAEQVMVGSAMGLAARGAIPFPSTFACFLTRARRFHPHGGHQQRQHQAGRLARRRLDRRRRTVADGARGSGDVPGAAELSRCSTRATRSAPSGWSRSRPTIRGRPTSGPAGRRPPVIYANDETFEIGGTESAAPDARTTSRPSSAPA